MTPALCPLQDSVKSGDLKTGSALKTLGKTTAKLRQLFNLPRTYTDVLPTFLVAFYVSERAKPAKIPCPYCDAEDHQTRNTRREGSDRNPLLVRKHLCNACGGAFETFTLLDRPTGSVLDA